ncbi:amidohydrolase [Ferrovibrio sp.]|uniref:amidohydrolase n=1 Tax=Ferrovibrio sp. TaxID=1917215 RepID=UPI0025C13D48|nr:amidohydrolase [Ferrovibrio sp.]MBX3454030.1 amidohydrolase [Ferrovibrio sp.]
MRLGFIGLALTGLTLTGLGLTSLVLAGPARAADMPIFDAHLHYSHDAWNVVPPAEAVKILRQAGLRKAMVSSSDDEGTQKLHALAPDLVLPVLRPYRKRSDISTWMRDDSVIDYLQQRLARYRYVGIGEFHIYGADADLPVVRRMVQLAKQYKLYLHLHGDAEAVQRVLVQDQQARILWAHSGFDQPDKVSAMLDKHPALWADLAFRNDQASVDAAGKGKVAPAWRDVFMRHADRFLVGTDTFAPERWYYVIEHAKYSRAWLADLPSDVADKIGWQNGERLFAKMLEAD